jgi:hypothetical protein
MVNVAPNAEATGSGCSIHDGRWDDSTEMVLNAMPAPSGLSEGRSEMKKPLIVVNGYVATDRDHPNLRELTGAVSFALDQRAFGRRRLLVAFADRAGRFRALAHTRRTDPPEAALPA